MPYRSEGRLYSIGLASRPAEHICRGKPLLSVIDSDQRKPGPELTCCAYLQEGARMKCNVGGVDKWLRIAVGLLLIVWAVAGGPVWAWIGVVPLVTGLFNFCPLYTLIGVSTCKR